MYSNVNTKFVLIGGVKIFFLKELIKFIMYFILVNLILHYVVKIPFSQAAIIALVTGVVSFIFDFKKYYKSIINKE